MNRYMCDGGGTEAVAIFRHCRIAQCREHSDEALTAHRPAGLVRLGCVHNPIDTVRRRGNIRALESLL